MKELKGWSDGIGGWPETVDGYVDRWMTEGRTEGTQARQRMLSYPDPPNHLLTSSIHFEFPNPSTSQCTSCAKSFRSSNHQIPGSILQFRSRTLPPTQSIQSPTIHTVFRVVINLCLRPSIRPSILHKLLSILCRSVHQSFCPSIHLAIPSINPIARPYMDP